jgi:GTPase SAR1 family protein
MNLPTTKTPIARRDPRVIVLYGSPKVGKTTVLSQLDSNLIIDNENGTDYIEALKVKVSTIQELRDVAAALKKEPMKYQRITLETVTTLEDWAEELGTKNYKRSTTGKNFQGPTCLTLANGGGYLWLRLAFKELIELFSGVTGTLILVAHLREKSLESGGKEVTTKDIELTGKIRTIVCAFADAVGLLYRDKDKLMITFESKETVLCGSRCDHLKGQTFEMDWSKIFVEDQRETPAPLIEYSEPVA